MEVQLTDDREQRRTDILAAVDAAEASLARGEGRRITTQEESVELAEEIKRRGVRTRSDAGSGPS